MKKILRKFVCGNIPETEGDIGVDESVLFERETRFSNMLDHNNRVMDNLKVQTECYKSEFHHIYRFRAAVTYLGTAELHSRRFDPGEHRIYQILLPD